MDFLSKSWREFKAMCRKIKSSVRWLLNRMQTEFDVLVPSRSYQYFIVAAYFLLVGLIAYLIALFNIGIGAGTMSVFGMAAAYYEAGRAYPAVLLLLLSLLLIVGFYFIVQATTENEGRNFKYSDADTYGSAREISIEELEMVADVKPITALSGTILGQLDTTGQRVIGIPPNPIMNKNLIVFGTPGDGKSFSVVENQIVQAIRRGESVVCTDTKYEVRAETLELARLYGYTVKFLDLKDLAYSDGWHVLKELRCDDVRAAIFAEIVMKNTGNEKDPHLALEQSLLKACCLYVERCRSIPDEERTLYHAYSMILQGPEALDKCFASIKYDSDLKTAYDAYAPFKGSENLRNNVVANLTSRLQILSTARIMTSTDDIDLTLPGRQKCIYYCCMSDMHETMKFLATLYFSFLFLDLVDFADSQLTRSLPVPVNVILEEAANIGHIVGLSRYLATARSRAISITLVLQSMGQLKAIYGDEETETILNTCSIHACIGTNDKTTADHFEWLSGTATIQVKTEQHPEVEGHLQSRFNHSTGDGKRNVFTSNEVRKIRRGYILLGWKGYDTIMCRTFGINQHPEFVRGHMPKIEPHTHIPLANTEARAFLRAMEEKRVADYDAWEKDGGNAWKGYEFPQPKYDGPSRNKPAPPVIPYPELEQMALDYAAQAKNPLCQEISRREEVAESEPAMEIPEKLVWQDTPLTAPPPAPPPAAPAAPSASAPAPNDPGLNAPPIVLPEHRKKPIPPPTESLTPPAIRQPKRSGNATLYGKTIKKAKPQK